MKILLVMCTAVSLVVSAAAANAADTAARNPANAMPGVGAGTPSNKTQHIWTLDEARKHAHEYADRLDKMTPQEWGEMRKKRQESLEKWRRMTPQERKAYFQNRAAKVHTQQ